MNIDLTEKEIEYMDREEIFGRPGSVWKPKDKNNENETCLQHYIDTRGFGIVPEVLENVNEENWFLDYYGIYEFYRAYPVH